jgi:sn-glycerol 3-phosphate transport system substrate-binding protein
MKRRFSFGLIAVIVLLTTANLGVYAQGKPLEIEFWTLLSGQIGEKLNSLINQYNSIQQNVKILNVNSGSYNSQQEKMLAAVAARKFPVISMIDYKNVPFYASNGWLESLNKYASQADMADFIPGLLDDLTLKGQLYALPYNRSTQGLYYNKDLFAKAGLDPNKPPETWDDVVKYGKAIEALGNGCHGIYATGNMQWYFEPMVYEWGGQFSDKDGHFTFNDKQGVEAAQFLQDLVFKYKVAVVPSNLSGSWDQQAIEFVNGKIGMMRQSTALNKYMQIVNFNWGFAMLPAGPKGRFVTGGGANIAVSAKASEAEKKAAWDFIKWLTGTENSADFHMDTGYMPSRNSVQKLPSVQAFYKTNPTWLVTVNELKYTKSTSTAVLNSPSWGVTIEAAMDRIILNKESPQKVLDEIAKELNASIDESKKAGTFIIK